MAIDKYFLKSAVRVLNKIRRDYRTNVATLGYPDLMVSETDLKKTCEFFTKINTFTRKVYSDHLKA